MPSLKKLLSISKSVECPDFWEINISNLVSPFYLFFWPQKVKKNTLKSWSEIFKFVFTHRATVYITGVEVQTKHRRAVQNICICFVKFSRFLNPYVGVWFTIFLWCFVKNYYWRSNIVLTFPNFKFSNL